ncbi:trifunctional purine biosynthetic protein adenosine-3-like [Saccoglossus kowalevskii]|uniref:Trifunctional purine biosynthetic protein adenosine-3 n=1 Tax=Saccoglossus kowalevskii TaxID=10224 RepID=A0ABM0GN64_SACKO|nr:PREDICTED: trifunctional purine biosynthetic protein adenosine-3-like [Saccoglossus kowalevskii]
MGDTVLVIGSGGREHTLAWKLAQSDLVKKVLVAPGNAGTKNKGKIDNADISAGDHDKLIKWCKENVISMVVIGPENPLADGIADALSAASIPCFGPSANGAEIEASKNFAKAFMDRHMIPTAKWKSFTSAEDACQHINTAPYKALVVKASGLAAGKGVIVANTTEEACQAVREMMTDKLFGAAGETVVVEELLEGEEVSVLAFSDGSTFAPMPPAQDHKRLLEGDKGPNTGGMGAYCPCPQVSVDTLQSIHSRVLSKTIQGMKEEGRPYTGVIYAGLMLTSDGPKVLEFNCRFGDPECQVILPLLKSDLYVTMTACVKGTLSDSMPVWHADQYAVGVVLASGGYPASYKKGMEITGLESIEAEMGQLIFHAGTAIKDGKTVTSGGRVLANVAMATDLPTAATKALEGAAAVKFTDAIYRKDIAQKGCDFVRKQRDPKKGLSYSGCGVSIDAGNLLVDKIKSMVKSTSRSGCDAVIGGFGGVFDLKAAGYQDPLLVSGTDGVGTKLKVAQACGRHQTIGIDLVAMCVNDILAHGAESLFFLDYFACGKLQVNVARDVVCGVAEGCKLAGCALLGGETAEMPGMYAEGDYDLAGFAVGAVDRKHTLPQMEKISSGDVILGVASSGVHSNGYSLVRKVVEQSGYLYSSPSPFSPDKSLGEDLLTPTKIYSKTLLPAIQSGHVKAYAHITGGGLLENIPRVLPGNNGAMLDASRWDIPSVFGWIQNKGNVAIEEMARTFNCGIGAVLVVSQERCEDVLEMVKSSGEKVSVIGNVIPTIKGISRVQVQGLDIALSAVTPQDKVHTVVSGQGDHKSCVNGGKKMKVAVLISGTGTNLQALIDHTIDPKVGSCAEIALVISNIPGVKGLERAEKAGIPTKVIRHKEFKSRVEFDMKVHETLASAGIEFICLAGFMRILSGEFVRKWHGRLINVHPSLLPSFKGMNAHKLVLEAGVRVTGCSVHFVVEEVDAGAIIVQEAVPVCPGDTIETLQERVKGAEHKAYPRALELIASNALKLGDDGRIMWLNSDI